MKKLFRFHRGGLAESLSTTREVTGLQELKCEVRSVYPFVTNIHISKTHYNDTRLPEEWGGTTHYVLANFDGYESQCIGMCNFYEK